MTKHILSCGALLLVSNSLWAAPVYNESLLKSVLTMQASQTQQQASPSTTRHLDMQNNGSLLSAVLAKQGVKQNIEIDSASKIDYSHYDSSSQQFHSLFSAALTKHFKNADKTK